MSRADGSGRTGRAGRTGRTGRAGGRALLVLRAAAAARVVAAVASAARREPPVRPLDVADAARTLPSISVVVPARDEERRIEPLLRALVGAPAVAEVIVVDDESRDATAEVAARLGATVVSGRALPDGWAGKAWAMQQGAEAARGEWVVFLDADTRPEPVLPAAVVARAITDRLDVLTVAGRFRCPTEPATWLHASMLTTLVVRYGAPGWIVEGPTRRRLLANGQCMAVPRRRFLDDGGTAPVRGAVVEDVALVRQRARDGRRVAMLDAGALLTTEMFADLRSTWLGWGRSIALPGVDGRVRAVLDAGTLALALAAPIPRLVLRRGDAIDLVLLAVRAGTLIGTAAAYERRRLGYWLSPTADVPATAAVALGALRRGQSWRGRTYPHASRRGTGSR